MLSEPIKVSVALFEEGGHYSIRKAPVVRGAGSAVRVPTDDESTPLDEPMKLEGPTVGHLKAAFERRSPRVVMRNVCSLRYSAVPEHISLSHLTGLRLDLNWQRCIFTFSPGTRHKHQPLPPPLPFGLCAVIGDCSPTGRSASARQHVPDAGARGLYGAF